METPFLNDPVKSPEADTGRTRKQILASFVVILAGVSAYFLLFKTPPRGVSQGNSRLEFGQMEKAYAPSLHLGNFAMKQAENFLNQEVKILEGDVLNAGDRNVTAVDATIEFRDSLDQIALKETRPLVPPSPEGLKPGQVAHFEISFDHVPSSWNYQMPRVTVSGLKLTGDKKTAVR
jgi:hypothetical protein